MSWLSVTDNGVILQVHVVPRSSKTIVQGLYGNAIKVRLQAPPVEGKANAALVECLSEALGVHPRQVVILAGAAGRKKRVLLSMVGEQEVRSKLGLSASA